VPDPVHSLLKRQIRRQFGDEVPEGLMPFLSMIDRTYRDFDADRLLMERSLELSSQELMRTNAELRTLIGAFPDLFFRLDERGVILSCKGGTREEFMLPAERLIGKRIQDIPVPGIGCAFEEALKRVRTTHALASLDYSMPVQGIEAHYEARLLPFMEDQFIVIVRNITERRNAEESLLNAQDQLRQSQKMEAVGRLAGGVAHDFNNLLTAIRGYCDLAMARLHDAAQLRKSLQEIQKISDRAAMLTRQLLAFSRRQVLQPKLVDLNECVNNMEVMLRRLIGEHIDLTVILDPLLHRVKIDPGQLEQVIMNLVINARDAEPEGGRIILETSNAKGDSGLRVLLSVTDTGHGMDKDTLARIFEPFFTTKDAGRGTGLGLSMVYGIVKQSGGDISVESEVGWGSTFRISLPALVEGIPLLAGEKADSRSRHGSELILLVEDEDSVREVAQEILKDVGYSVISAKNGHEALRVSREHEGSISLVMTDMVMPGMNGRQLAESISAIRPGLRVLFTSGYTDDTTFFNGALDDRTPFLQKPFSADMLLRKVREALEAPPPAWDGPVNPPGEG
jgi:signal transduction histidine kinase/ActR/RegA family two-component response regulator